MSKLPPCDHDECPPTECLRYRISQLEAALNEAEVALVLLADLERPFQGLGTHADKGVKLADKALATIRKLKESK